MKKINWKDFKIKDLQPNLIPNGWDSFEPYGSGLNNVVNWNFNSSDLTEFHTYATTLLVDNNTLKVTEDGWGGDANFRWEKTLPKGNYVARYKVIAPFGITEKQWSNTSQSEKEVKREKNREYAVYETYFEVQDENKKTQIKFFPTNENTAIASKGNYFIFDWIQITPVDNQHLVVEKTPIGNGLTRIQTWGGNNAIKLLYNFPVNIEGNHNLSMLVELNDRFTITLNNKNLKNIFVDESRYINETHNFSKETFANVQIRVSGNDSLDFIASDPQIVEGDKANPALIVTDLDDGREHVQVYGAYPDTKLISKEVQGFSGEPYQIKTDIDNDGVALTMTSTLGDKSIDINKGSNSISHTGELQGQHIIIELGAKYE